MALSVRQLEGHSTASVQHYLVQQVTAASTEKSGGGHRMKLECSDHTFENILSLVYHYCTVK